MPALICFLFDHIVGVTKVARSSYEKKFATSNERNDESDQILGDDLFQFVTGDSSSDLQLIPQHQPGERRK
jgi:hypothetical protein